MVGVERPGGGGRGESPGRHAGPLTGVRSRAAVVWSSASVASRPRHRRADAASFRPRKLPRQGRSAATVAALVEATGRLLVERGYDGATTRRIAERAGVSVGSLYQYFPSRDALVTAVLERHVDEVLARIGALLRRVERAPLPRAIRTLVDAVLDLHDRDPGLHVVLMEQLPRADRTPLLARIERVLGSHLRAFLRGRDDGLARLDVERAMFVLSRACIPLIHAPSPGPAGPSSQDRRAEDLALVIEGYLRAAAGRSPGREAATRTPGRREA